MYVYLIINLIFFFLYTLYFFYKCGPIHFLKLVGKPDVLKVEDSFFWVLNIFKNNRNYLEIILVIIIYNFKNVLVP